MCEFLRVIPAHFCIFGGFWCGLDLLCGFLMCGWRGFGLFFSFLVLKVSSLKMVKKWLENLFMKIILFNTKNKRVPKIRLLRVVKKSALRLERANLANF